MRKSIAIVSKFTRYLKGSIESETGTSSFVYDIFSLTNSYSCFLFFSTLIFLFVCFPFARFFIVIQGSSRHGPRWRRMVRHLPLIRTFIADLLHTLFCYTSIDKYKIGTRLNTTSSVTIHAVAAMTTAAALLLSAEAGQGCLTELSVQWAHRL